MFGSLLCALWASAAFVGEETTSPTPTETPTATYESKSGSPSTIVTFSICGAGLLIVAGTVIFLCVRTPTADETLFMGSPMALVTAEQPKEESPPEDHYF